MTVKAHYENHLARVYSWMLGDFRQREEEQQTFFSSHNITPGVSNVAYDLGSGNGIQAVALAKMGFLVTAVDFNPYLLAELKQNADNLPVEVVESDFLSFLQAPRARPFLITCMGDTLTHLENIETVNEMIRKASDLLMVNGRIVISYRDLSKELRGVDRFIHVRSDDTRTMTCFLEFFPAHVMVHDIITEKHSDGWRQTVSHYPKLRLSETAIIQLITDNGINIISRTVVKGMLYLVGRKSIPTKPSL